MSMCHQSAVLINTEPILIDFLVVMRLNQRCIHWKNIELVVGKVYSSSFVGENDCIHPSQATSQYFSLISRSSEFVFRENRFNSFLSCSLYFFILRPMRRFSQWLNNNNNNAEKVQMYELLSERSCTTVLFLSLLDKIPTLWFWSPKFCEYLLS